MQKADLQRRFLARLAQTQDVGRALAGVALSVDALQRWRAESAEFDDVVARVLRRPDVPVPGLEEFRLAFFGHASPPHHRLMVRAIESAVPASITLILAFPEAAKTTLLVDHACRRLVVDPNWRIAVVTEGSDLAEDIVGQVATRMSDEEVAPEFLATFGPFRDPTRVKSWSAKRLQVLRASHDEKEPSLHANGVGSKIYGRRYDEIFMDDIQSSQNLSETAKLLKFVRQTSFTRLAAGVGRMVCVGSRVGVGDVWERMLEERMVDTLVRIPALVWVDDPLRASEIPADEMFVRRNGRVVLIPGVENRVVSTWPEHWPLDRLATYRAKMGEEIWARTYQQLDVVDANAAFPASVVEASLDAGRGFGPIHIGTDTVCTLDPGFGEGVCAVSALAFTPERLYVLDSLPLRGMGTTEEILATVGQWSARFRPSRWVVEINAFQRGLATDQRMNDLASRWGFSVVQHVTHRNKNDPVLGVRQMGSSFAAGEVSIPWAGSESQDRMKPLCRQLVRWVPSRGVEVEQDLVMGLWFGWLLWQEEKRLLGLAMQSLPRPSWMRS